MISYWGRGESGGSPQFNNTFIIKSMIFFFSFVLTSYIVMYCTYIPRARERERGSWNMDDRGCFFVFVFVFVFFSFFLFHILVKGWGG